MRFVHLIAWSGMALACAGSSSPRTYRASGVGATATAVGPGDLPGTYVVDLGNRVSFAVQADTTAGAVRVRTTVRNDGSEPVAYDVQRATVAAADGRLLRLDSEEEERGSGSAPSGAAAVSPRPALRTIRQGERVVLTRRYALADGVHLDRDLLLLKRLSLADEVRVDTRDVVVTLRLEEAR
jgi:hypothetical protein